MNKLVAGLAVAMLAIAGMNLVGPLESATPAIVNPIGWDTSQQKTCLDQCLKDTSTRAMASVCLRGQVLKLNPSIYLHLRLILDDYSLDESTVITMYKANISLYKAALK